MKSGNRWEAGWSRDIKFIGIEVFRTWLFLSKIGRGRWRLWYALPPARILKSATLEAPRATVEPAPEYADYYGR